MKKIWILVLILFFIISALTLTGCELGDNGFNLLEWLLRLFNGAS